MKEVRISDGVTEYRVAAEQFEISTIIDGLPMLNLYGRCMDSRYIRPEKTRRTDAQLKHVIFNDPATIIQWTDGTKTVVKCQPGDEYDPLKGFLLAFFKKACGNKSNYNNALKKIVPGYGAAKAEEERLEAAKAMLVELTKKLNEE